MRDTMFPSRSTTLRYVVSFPTGISPAVASQLALSASSNLALCAAHSFESSVATGNFAFVKRVSAMLCNLLERPRQIRIVEYLAHFRCPVSRKISLRCRFIGPQVIHFCRPVRSRPFGNRESVQRRSNRRRQILRQFL